MSSTTYLVSARKYRPLLFKDVVAQEHVTETLKNAIRMDRLAHAYLFTGPRGVGKTTAARIVAKAINCTTAPEDREDRAEPCRECVSCQSFEEGRNLNIIEIDAASNNKVDDVRDLRETVRIPPQNNRMKVYIIDEVHMLSNAAFNALLKTLEEPPPHAMFIFATTEPHKVLPTIQSRCQRFDFRRISVRESIDRLKMVCEAEGIEADESSLMLMARKGDGALRDALSVFDQAVSLCGNSITHAELVKALGVVDTDIYFDVTSAASNGSGSDMIRIVDRVVRAGYDLLEFVDGLAEHLRNFLVAITVEDLELIEATEAIREKINTHSQNFTESTLLSMVHIVSELSSSLRLSRQPRLRLEMALLKLAKLPSSIDIRSALEKLDRLEKMAQKGEIQLLVRQPASTPLPMAVPEAAEVAVVPDVAPAKEQAAPEAVTVPEAAKAKMAPEPVPLAEPPELDEETLPSPTPEAQSAATEVAAVPQELAGNEQPVISEDSRSLFGGAPAIKNVRSRPDNSAGLEVEDDVMVLEQEQQPEEKTGTESTTLLEASWQELITEVMSEQKQLGSFLKHAVLVGFESKTVLLGVPDDFHVKALRSDRAKLAFRLSELSGIHVERIAFRIDSSDSEGTLTHESESATRQKLDKLCEEYPAVRSLVERFGGEIVW